MFHRKQQIATAQSANETARPAGGCWQKWCSAFTGRNERKYRGALRQCSITRPSECFAPRNGSQNHNHPRMAATNWSMPSARHGLKAVSRRRAPHRRRVTPPGPDRRESEDELALYNNPDIHALCSSNGRHRYKNGINNHARARNQFGATTEHTANTNDKLLTPSSLPFSSACPKKAQKEPTREITIPNTGHPK